MTHFLPFSSDVRPIICNLYYVTNTEALCDFVVIVYQQAVLIMGARVSSAGCTSVAQLGLLFLKSYLVEFFEKTRRRKNRSKCNHCFIDEQMNAVQR